MSDISHMLPGQAKSRRSFLKLSVAAALVLPLFGRTLPAKAGTRFHIVNGWILTDADVAALRKFGLRTRS
jgi:hypothetical protein